MGIPSHSTKSKPGGRPTLMKHTPSKSGRQPPAKGGLTGQPLKTRKRRTRAQIAQLDAQILDVLASDHPQSVRHVFYRMTDPRLPEPVEKSDAGYNAVQRRCVELRRGGSISYGWISDATRRGYHVAAFDGPGDFIRRMSGMYRERLWSADLPHVEVWVESRSLAGVLQDDCEELGVSLYPSGGFSSVTLPYEAARQIDGREREKAIVLYVGDYDPAGVLIDPAIERELRQHLDTPLEFHRLAINPDQIEEHDLPTKPRKAGDRRRLDIDRTVEAEAMPAASMRRIVREAVESYLPAGALQAAKVAEESEREGLERLGLGISQFGIDGLIGD